MALLRRVLCWSLRTSSLIGFFYVMVSSSSALLLRVLDLAATASNGRFIISRGFNVQWRSHQWQSFLASNIIMSVCHVVTLLFTAYMIHTVMRLVYVAACMCYGACAFMLLFTLWQHFVLYMRTLSVYNYCFIMYTIIEFFFSTFEFSYYGKNTFRREYLVFVWFWWIFRTCINAVFIAVLFSRSSEMADEMAMELRFSEKKYVHSYA